MPWRCGQNWANPGFRAAQGGDFGQDGGRVQNGDVVPALRDSGHDVAGLGQVRGAGHVGHHAAGPDRVDGRVEQLALQAGQFGYVGGGLAPPGFGAAAQRPEAGARDVRQDAVERARLATAPGVRPRRGRRGPRRPRGAGIPGRAAPGAGGCPRRPGGHRGRRRGRSAAGPCRRGPRTGRARAGLRRTGRIRVRASAASWLASSWTAAWPLATRGAGSPPASR